MTDQLKKLGADVMRRHEGIYQIERAGFFPTQIVVTGELKTESHAILRVLSNRVRQQDVRAFLRMTRDLRSPGDIARLDAILQVSVTANRSIYDEIYREDSEMCQALREIMREDFEKAEARGISIGEARGADQRTRDIAKNMKEANIDSSIIAKTTGLSQQVINAL